MPEVTAPGRDTRETLVMQLASKILTLQGRGPLPTFIAARRLPGPAWKTWGEIAYEFAGLLDTPQVMSTEILRQWARRYNIPDSKRDDGIELIGLYLDQLDARGIDLPTGAFAKARNRDHDLALAENRERDHGLALAEAAVRESAANLQAESV